MNTARIKMISKKGSKNSLPRIAEKRWGFSINGWIPVMPLS
jgi:hypothetical protein